MPYKRAKKKKLLIELEEDQEELLHKFKVKTLMNKSTMKDKIIEFVKEYVSHD